jgi:hypothetical protein
MARSSQWNGWFRGMADLVRARAVLPVGDPALAGDLVASRFGGEQPSVPRGAARSPPAPHGDAIVTSSGDVVPATRSPVPRPVASQRGESPKPTDDAPKPARPGLRW